MRLTRCSFRQGAGGFSLLELMVVVAIAAVLLAVAVPNLRNQILASQARQTARGIQDALDYARQYALNTATLTTFTPSGCGYSVTAMGPGQAVLTSSSGTGGWLVDCSSSPNGAVSFLGDGSAVTCSGSAGQAVCTPLSSNLTFSASAGGATWTVTLLKSGLTTMSSTP